MALGFLKLFIVGIQAFSPSSDGKQQIKYNIHVRENDCPLAILKLINLVQMNDLCIRNLISCHLVRVFVILAHLSKR
jgi:hypothetical protein